MTIRIPISRVNFGADETAAVTAVMESGMLVQGPRVAALEEAFAQYVGVQHAVAVNSGTSALLLALLALDVQPGAEVITTPFTFWASASAIMMCGAVPVFVDIDPATFNLDPTLVQAAITPRTVGILPVHLYGQPVDIRTIKDIAQKHGLWVLEDACQAHGAIYNGQMVGGIGEAAAFSFYPTKNLACAGESGMITTNNDALAGLARLMRQHGMQRRYYHDIFGFNYRMNDLAAAVALVQLGRLPGFNEQRELNAAMLISGLTGTPLVLPEVRSGVGHVWHQFTVRVPDGQRDALVAHLGNAGVGTGVFYPLLVTQQPAYHAWIAKYGFQPQAAERTPVALAATGEVLSLPVHPLVTKDDIATIVAEVTSFFGR